MMKPDWWMWDAHEEVVIWQAVALSLNIDPEAMSGNQLMRANGYSGGSIDPIGDGYTDGEFDKRRRLLEKRYAKEPSVGYLDQDGEVQYIDNKIVLHDVARLLTSLGREVPYEFASFSEAVITTPLTPSGINNQWVIRRSKTANPCLPAWAKRMRHQWWPASMKYIAPPAKNYVGEHSKWAGILALDQSGKGIGKLFATAIYLAAIGTGVSNQNAANNKG